MSKVLERMREALGLKNKKMGRPMTDTGAEILDGTPVAPPVGFSRTLTVEQRILQALRSEQMALADEAAGREGIVEFNDFGDEEDNFDEIFPASRFESVALDAQRMGAEYRRSKRERDRLEADQDRFVQKLATAVRGDYEDEPAPEPRTRSPRKSSSGARPAPEGAGKGVEPAPADADGD